MTNTIEFTDGMSFRIEEVDNFIFDKYNVRSIGASLFISLSPLQGFLVPTSDYDKIRSLMISGNYEIKKPLKEISEALRNTIESERKEKESYYREYCVLMSFPYPYKEKDFYEKEVEETIDLFKDNYEPKHAVGALMTGIKFPSFAFMSNLYWESPKTARDSSRIYIMMGLENPTQSQKAEMHEYLDSLDSFIQENPKLECLSDAQQLASILQWDWFNPSHEKNIRLVVNKIGAGKKKHGGWARSPFSQLSVFLGDDSTSPVKWGDANVILKELQELRGDNAYAKLIKRAFKRVNTKATKDEKKFPSYGKRWSLKDLD